MGHTGSGVEAAMALELRMTRKCVVSEGVMVTVFSDSDLSLRLTCDGVSEPDAHMGDTEVS